MWVIIRWEVILNKSSVDRGMFCSLYLRSYEDEETDETEEISRFKNPDLLKNIIKNEKYDYSFLDDNGIIKEDVEINKKENVITNTVTISNRIIKFH